MSEIILTVSMPNYNHAKYLTERIPSLLAAMPKNSELIIVDDGSTDGSAEIIEKFSVQDTRLVFIKKPKNEGVISALENILSNARGKYISFQSSDDYILPNFFSRMLQFASEHPDFGLYCSNFGFCTDSLPKDQSEIQANFLLKDKRQPTLFPADRIVKTFRTTDFWVPGHASLISLNWIKKLGGFDARLSQHADWFLIHSVALMGGVAYLPETLAVWRMDSNSFTSQEMRKKQELFLVHMNFFKILHEKGQESLYVRFRNSNILRGAIRKRLLSLLIRPQYWDFLLFYLFGFLQRRIKNLGIVAKN